MNEEYFKMAKNLSNDLSKNHVDELIELLCKWLHENKDFKITDESIIITIIFLGLNDGLKKNPNKNGTQINWQE